MVTHFTDEEEWGPKPGFHDRHRMEEGRGKGHRLVELSQPGTRGAGTGKGRLGLGQVPRLSECLHGNLSSALWAFPPGSSAPRPRRLLFTHGRPVQVVITPTKCCRSDALSGGCVTGSCR